MRAVAGHLIEKEPGNPLTGCEDPTNILENLNGEFGRRTKTQAPVHNRRVRRARPDGRIGPLTPHVVDKSVTGSETLWDWIVETFLSEP